MCIFTVERNDFWNVSLYFLLLGLIPRWAQSSNVLMLKINIVGLEGLDSILQDIAISETENGCIDWKSMGQKIMIGSFMPLIQKAWQMEACPASG